MLYDVNIKEIKPNGWLKSFIETQMSGLTGNISQAGFPFDCIEWGKEDYAKESENPMWWVYEQTAYWLDGFIRCAILLNDDKAIKKASNIIYSAINKADKDGYIGPLFMKETDGWNRWPHVVFFRACMALYDYTNDRKIIDALTKHYLGRECEFDYERDVLNVEIMLWIYGKTKNNKLLELAVKNYEKYNIDSKKHENRYKNSENNNCESFANSRKKPYAHGVTYNEFAKLGAILYIYTKDEKYLKASVNAYKKIDKYFMLPDGCPCSNEFLINNYYMQSHETCNVSDYTWSLYYLTKATCNSDFLDKIEKCIYNAGIGSVLEDFKGLQYFSCCNQLILDKNSNHNIFFHGDKWMSYRPNPGTECCPGNVNRFMPNFISKLWMKDDNDGIYLTLFGANELNTEIKGKNIRITEETNYPFNEDISIKINADISFDFYIRIPKWSNGNEILFNGNNYVGNMGEFYKITIPKGESDIVVKLSSDIRQIPCYEGVYFQKGALVYSLGMKGQRYIDIFEKRSSKDFPAYNIYPNEKWNYAIIGNTTKYIGSENVSKWDLSDNLPYIEVQAREIEGYKLIKRKRIKACTNLYNLSYCNKEGEFTFTPKIPTRIKYLNNTKSLRLYPMGACKVRLTVLPICKSE